MPAKPIAVFFADSHLADRAWTERPITGDAYHAFAQIIDYAVNRELPVFAAGDLIDKAVNRSAPIAFAYKQFDRLHDVERNFFFCQGQHDMSDPPWFSGHPAAKHLNLESTRVGEVNVYGLDFTPSPQLQIVVGQLPSDTDVLMAHQVWSLWMGDVTIPQGGPQDVASASVVFTGDYHYTEETDTVGRGGQPLKFISPGSTYMCSIDEPTTKRFFVLMDDLTWRKVKLRTRPVVEWPDVNRADLVDHMVATVAEQLTIAWDQAVDLPEGIRKPLLWVKYDKDLPDVKRRVERAVDGKAHIFWKPLIIERPEVVERREAARAAGQRRGTTMASLLPQYLKDRQLDNLAPAATRLLQATDPEGELRRMREEELS